MEEITVIVDDLTESVVLGVSVSITDHTELTNIGTKTHATLDSEVDANNIKVGVTTEEANPDLISQLEAETGTSTTERTFNALRVAQAIAALGGGGGADGVNVETITANKALVESDDKYQFIACASSYNVNLPDNPTTGTTFFIKNNNIITSSIGIIIRDFGGAALDVLYVNGLNGYIWQGSYWKGLYWGINGTDIAIEESSIQYGYNSKAYNSGTSFGYIADSYTQGVAFGYNSKGYTTGVAVGFESKGYDRGVGIGHTADGANRGVAAGYKPNTNNKYYSNALGYYSETERYGETSINIDGQSDQENNHGLAGQTQQTSNATPIAMLSGGTSGQRFTIRASSIVAFDIQVSARDNTSGDCAVYQFVGAIKRDAANNTALVGSVTKTVIGEDDASWDVSVTADDTNEALQISVTGDATNIVQWVASIRYTETHF